MPALTARRICVDSGRDWPRSRKISPKRGITNVRRKMTAPAPTSVRSAGIDRRRHHRLAELLRLAQEFGQPLERGLQEAALLAGAHHVDVQARERARVVLGERVRKRGAAADAAQEVAGDLAQRACWVSSSRMPRERSMGTPASSRVASCCVNSTRSRWLTRRTPRDGQRELARPSSCGATLMGKYASRWRRSTTERASGASMTPSMALPCGRRRGRGRRASAVFLRDPQELLHRGHAGGGLGPAVLAKRGDPGARWRGGGSRPRRRAAGCARGSPR